MQFSMVPRPDFNETEKLKFELDNLKRQKQQERHSYDYFEPAKESEDLGRENARLKRENRTLMDENDSLLHENDQLREKIKLLSLNYDDYDKEKLKSYINELANENEQLIKERKKYLRQGNDKMDFQNFLLGLEIMRLVEVIKQYDSISNRRNNKIKVLEKEKEDIINQMNQMQKSGKFMAPDSSLALDGHQESGGMHKIKELEDQLEKLLSENQRNLEKLRFKKISSEKLQKRLDDLMTENVLVKMQLEAVAKNTANYDSGIEARLTEANAKNQNLLKMNSELKQQNEEQDRFAQQLSDEVTKLTEQMRGYANSSREIQSLKDQLAEKEKQMSGLMNASTMTSIHQSDLEEVTRRGLLGLMKAFENLPKQSSAYFDAQTIKMKADNLINRIGSLGVNGSGQMGSDAIQGHKTKINSFIADQSGLYAKLEEVIQKHLNSSKGGHYESPRGKKYTEEDDFEERIEIIDGKPTKVKYFRYQGDTPHRDNYKSRSETKVIHEYSPQKGHQQMPIDYEIVKSRNRELEGINQQLQHTIDQLLDSKELLRKELDKIGGELIEKDNQIERMRLSERTPDLTGRDTLRQDILDLRNMLNEKQHEIEELEDERSELRNRYNILEDQLQERTSLIEQLEEKLESLMMEVQTLQRIADAKDSEQTIAGLSKELETLSEQNQSQSQLIKKLQEEKNGLVSELDDALDQLNLMKQDLDNQKVNYDSLWKICEQKDSDLKAKERELAQLRDELHQSKKSIDVCSQLSREVDDLKHVKQAYEKLRKESAENIEELTKTVNDLSLKLAHLKPAHESLQGQNEQLKIQIQELAQKLRQSSEDQEEKIEKIKAKRDEVEDLLRKSLNENAVIKGENEGLKRQFEGMINQDKLSLEKLQDLQDDIESLRGELRDKQMEINRLTLEKQGLESIREENANKETQMMKKIADELKERLDSQEKLVKMLQEDNHDLTDENEELKAQLRDKIDRLDELESGVKLLEQKIADQNEEEDHELLNQIDLLRSQLEDSLDELEKTKHELVRAEKQLEEESRNNQRQLDEKESELKQLRAQVKNSMEALDDLKSEIKQQDGRGDPINLSQLGTLQQKFTEMETAQKDLIAELLQLKTKVKEKEDENLHLKESYKDLKDRFSMASEQSDSYCRKMLQLQKEKLAMKLKSALLELHKVRREMEIISQDNNIFRQEFGSHFSSISELFEDEAEIAPKGTLDKLRKMKKALHDSNQSLAAKQGDKNQHANNRQIHQLEQEIDRLREENESIKNALLGAEYRIEELQAEFNDEESSRDKKEHLLLELQKDLENFRDQLQEVEEKNTKLRTKNKALNDENEGLATKLEESISLVKELESQNHELQRRCEEYKKKLKVVQSEFQEIKDQIDDLESENKELRIELKENIQTMNELRTQLEMEQENASRRARDDSVVDENLVNQLKQQVRLLQEKIEQLRRNQVKPPGNVIDIYMDKDGRHVQTRHKSYDQLAQEREEGLELITQLTLKLHDVENERDNVAQEKMDLKNEVESCRQQLGQLSQKLSTFRNSGSQQQQHQQQRLQELQKHLERLMEKYEQKSQELSSLKKAQSQIGPQGAQTSPIVSGKAEDKISLVRDKIDILMEKMEKFVSDLEYLEIQKMSHPNPTYPVYKEQYEGIKKTYKSLCKNFINESIDLCQQSITLFENLQAQVKKRKSQLGSANPQ